jgi:peptide deformylase
MDVIVPVDQIPKLDEIQNVTDLPAAFKICKRLEAICEQQKGIGLSAVQVGIPLKLFVVKGSPTSRFASNDYYAYFANCEYSNHPDGVMVVSYEGCLSLRNEQGKLRHFEVDRSTKIHLTGTRLVFRKGAVQAEPIDAVLDVHEQSIPFAHEIDHHRCVLISEIGKEVSHDD